jgi:hypothetical protein
MQNHVMMILELAVTKEGEYADADNSRQTVIGYGAIALSGL